MSLTSSLFYTNKPGAVASRAIRSSITPANASTFAGHNSAQIRLEIPTGIPGQYLDCQQSYLKFAVAVTSGNSPKIDGAVYSIFDRMQISHNGVVLEAIDQYAHLCTMVQDITVSITSRAFDMNIYAGTHINAIGEGESLTTDATGNTKAWFCIPLVSGIMGTMQSKFLPIGDMRGTFELSLTLSPYGLTLANDTAALAYTVSDVEYMASIVELDPNVAGMIRKESLSRSDNMPAFQIPCTSWRNYSSSVALGNTAASVLVPVKVRSLKNILVSQRVQAEVTTTVGSKHYRRVGGTDFKSYQWRVGSYMIPQKPVNNTVEAYTELSKSMHNMSFTNEGQIARTNYFGAGDGKLFAIGLELESFSHRQETINCGIDSNNILVFWEPTWTAGIPANRRVDFFCNHDLLLLIDANGQSSVVF